MVTFAFVFFALPAGALPAAESWPGFRGQELQSRAADVTPPEPGAGATGALWRVAVPGSGYSSPVVSGDAVYVTTACETLRFPRLRYALAGLAAGLWVILAAGGALGLVSGRAAVRGLAFRRLRCLALPLLAASLAAGLAVWAGRLLGLGEAPGRAWLVSVAVVLSALALAGVSLPLRGRSWALIGWSYIAFTAIGYVCHPERDGLPHGDSTSALLSCGALLAMPVAGAGLLVIRRRRARRTDKAALAGGARGRPYVLLPVALLLGAIVFAEANLPLTRDGLAATVVSLSLRDGTTRWVREALTCPKRRLPGPNTQATPTAVTDGRHVVAWFGAAGVVCLDTKGRTLWTRREYLSEPIYGAVSSPVLKDGVLVLVSDLETRGRETQPSPAWIAGLNVATGERLWRQPRRAHPQYAGYATPLVEDRNGRSLVWVHGWYGLEGYALRTGEPVGRYAYAFAAAHLVAGPVREGDRLFIPGAAVHLCVDLAKLVAGEDPLLWSCKATGEITATPVIANGLVFLVAEHGKAMGLDLATGACRWEARLPGSYWASPVALADRVCFLNEQGIMTVLGAQPPFAPLARHALGEPVHASPAAVRNLLLRTDRSIQCLPWTLAGSATAMAPGLEGVRVPGESAGAHQRLSSGFSGDIVHSPLRPET